MGLLPRIAKLSIAATTLLALTSLPVHPDFRGPGSALTPHTAWAGGSPDETLKPPVTPPPEQNKAASVQPLASGSWLDANRQTSLRRLSLFERFELSYRLFRLFVSRY